MGNLSIREASILGIIYEFAKSGAAKEEFTQLEKKLESNSAKRLAIKMFNQGIADANRLANDAFAKKLQVIKQKPVRLQMSREDKEEYSKLLSEHMALTGKHFKRNSWDMHNKHSKLDAITIRIRRIHDHKDLKSVLADLNKKNGPDFNLSGAL